MAFMKNFAWIANWKITHRCNLRCTYCERRNTVSAAQPDTADFFAVAAKIAAYRPKYLNISGGEPTLVRELPAILQRIRAQWNPSVYVVHNGTQPDTLIAALPFVERLVISIDGPGEVNKRTKGIDGGRVLERMKPLVREAQRRGVGVSVNCVVSNNTFPYLRQLADAVHDAFPYVTLCFSPLIPPHSPDSILSHPPAWKEFCGLYGELRRQGRNVVETFDHVAMHEASDRIQCVNQYFMIRISPEGKISSCAMNVTVDPREYLREWKRAFSRAALRKARDMAGKLLAQRTSRAIDFSCTAPCYCEMWLDLLLRNRTNDAMPIYLRGLAQRISEEEIERLRDFAVRYVNPAFDVAFFRRELSRSLA